MALSKIQAESIIKFSFLGTLSVIEILTVCRNNQRQLRQQPQLG